MAFRSFKFMIAGDCTPMAIQDLSATLRQVANGYELAPSHGERGPGIYDGGHLFLGAMVDGVSQLVCLLPYCHILSPSKIKDGL